MDTSYWLERWSAGKIGFHADFVNSQLKEIWPFFSIRNACSVFVPFCGKSLDMVWLREQGHKIIGVEVSELACRQFFEEQNLNPEISENGPFKIFDKDGYRLYCGDLYEMTPDMFPSELAIFDRAALIALPPADQQQYVNKISELAPPGTTMLLITLRYAQNAMEGPPFSLKPENIRALYSGTFNIQPLKSVNRIEELQKFKEQGLKEIWEDSYKLTRAE